MQVINKLPAPFDVDDTLIMSSHSHDTEETPDNQQAHVVDPLTGNVLSYQINEPMIRLLKEEHAKGSCIIVWSRGGYKWAKAVVEALGLEDLVDMVMEKPIVYFDDKDIKDWLPYRVYIPYDVRYKNK